MRILFLTPMNPYPPVSGGQKVTLVFLKSYARYGKIHLAFFYEQDQEQEMDEFSTHLKGLCERVDAFPLALRYQKHRLRHMITGVRSLVGNMPFRLQKFHTKAMRDVVKQASLRDIDLVHCDFLHMSSYLSYFDDTPKVLAEHNIEWEIFMRHWRYGDNWGVRLFSWFEAKRLCRYEVHMANRCDRVLALSRRDKRQLERAGVSSPISVVPFAVEPNPIARFASESPSIISLGNLSAPGREQGTLWFYDKVWPQIKSAIPGVRWHIVGAAPGPQVQELHDGESIWTHGFLEQTELDDLLHTVQVCIVPLFIGGGIRIKILDMMGWGIPCVSTSVGVQGIDMDSVLVSDSAAGFAHNVIRLLTGPELWHRISSKGLDYVREHHSQSAIEVKFETMLEQVLEASGAGGNSA